MSLKAEMRKMCVYWQAGKPLYAIPMKIDKDGVCRIDIGLGGFRKNICLSVQRSFVVIFFWNQHAGPLFGVFISSMRVVSLCHLLLQNKYTLVQPSEQYSSMCSLLTL